MSQELHPATISYVHMLGKGIKERLQDGGAFTPFEAHAIASSITECLTTYPYKVQRELLKKKLKIRGFAPDFIEYVADGLRL